LIDGAEFLELSELPAGIVTPGTLAIPVYHDKKIAV
jgi:hypothetical protein